MISNHDNLDANLKSLDYKMRSRSGHYENKSLVTSDRITRITQIECVDQLLVYQYIY